MSERAAHRFGTVLRHADALLAWVLLGWLGQRLGWSFASGVLPVVLWWTLRCGGADWLVRLPIQRHWPKAWPHMVAAALLGSLMLLPAGHTALVMLLAGSALWGVGSASLSAGSAHKAPTLPSQAMGLMMGSLWLSSQWCLGPGWSDEQAVALHLALMIGVPLLLATSRHLGWAARHMPDWQLALLLAAGALLMAWPGATGGRLTGMVLLVMLWSLGTHGAMPVKIPSLTVPAGLGPLLLLAVGLWAPRLGPAAIQYAWWFIAAIALLALARWRPASDRPDLSTQR